MFSTVKVWLLGERLCAGNDGAGCTVEVRARGLMWCAGYVLQCIARLSSLLFTGILCKLCVCYGTFSIIIILLLIFWFYAKCCNV